MKKNKTQNRTPRRLSLNRETILVLNDPALLERARGGISNFDGCLTTTSADSNTCTYTAGRTEACYTRSCSPEN
jgi:hypothetical protein